MSKHWALKSLKFLVWRLGIAELVWNHMNEKGIFKGASSSAVIGWTSQPSWLLLVEC